MDEDDLADLKVLAQNCLDMHSSLRCVCLAREALGGRSVFLNRLSSSCRWALLVTPLAVGLYVWFRCSDASLVSISVISLFVLFACARVSVRRYFLASCLSFLTHAIAVLVLRSAMESCMIFFKVHVDCWVLDKVRVDREHIVPSWGSN